MKPSIVVSALVLLALAAVPVAAQEKCYKDRGKTVCFPLGVRSFADAVVRFDVGSPSTLHLNAMVVGTTLGEPDNVRSREQNTKIKQHYLTLGCGGVLILQFRDNALVDVPGADLYVFEIGNDVEPTHLSISADGTDWLTVGTIKGGLATVDIGKVAKKGQKYRYVRLQDARKRCGGGWPGADIDAVGSIGSVAVADGRLRLEIADEAAAVPTQIGLILDASGSMRGKLGGRRTKMQIARTVLRSIVSTLPDDVEVGLRVYGHRLARRPKNKSCRDTELVVPFGPLRRDRILNAIDSVRARGQTPIGRSLALLAEDFGSDPGLKIVVLVSDGIETCAPGRGDELFPLSVVSRLQARGYKFRVNVVGLDISKSESRRLLSQVASASGGQYFAANNSGELEDAIRKAVELGYRIEDSAGKIVGTGKLKGEPIELDPGRYTVFVQADREIRISNVVIEGGMETRLSVRYENSRPVVSRSKTPFEAGDGK